MENTDGINRKPYFIDLKFTGKKYKCNDIKYFDTFEEAQSEKRDICVAFLTFLQLPFKNQDSTKDLYLKIMNHISKEGLQFSVRIFKKLDEVIEDDVMVLTRIEEIQDE